MDSLKIKGSARFKTGKGKNLTAFHHHVQSIITLLAVTIIASGCLNSNQQVGTSTLVAESGARPTPASTLSELVQNLSSDDTIVRVVSAYALQDYDPDEVAAVAIPSLIDNLYNNNTEVQMSAAVLLGSLGSRAQISVPDLIAVMEDIENNLNVRRSAARVLAEIGDVSAVPALAQQLYQDSASSYFFEISCANSIAILANQKFRDVGASAYHSDADGVPWIVIDARNWWEQTGQYQDWGS